MTHISCAVCQSSEATTLFRPRRSPGPVVRCRRCGLVYISPVEDKHAIIETGHAGMRPELLTTDNLDDLGDCWELALLPDKEKEWPALRINALDALSRIERFARPPGRLLDFGCGWGFFLGVAQERGWEAYGLEPMPGQAVHARAKFGAAVVADVLCEDTFPAGTFDVVTAFQVFEHVPNPADVLKKLKPALRPGGVILIEVPNIDTWRTPGA